MAAAVSKLHFHSSGWAVISATLWPLAETGGRRARMRRPFLETDTHRREPGKDERDKMK